MKLFKKVDELTNTYSRYQISDEIHSYIQEFHDFDSTSQTFRYSGDKNGNPWIENHDTIGLDTLKNYMENIESEFYGLYTDLYEENKIRREIERENKPDY